MIKHNRLSGTAAFLILISLIVTGVLYTQTRSEYDSIEIEQRIKKLQVLGSVLYIAAHPDDENTALLAWLAKEKQVKTAYLSLTRGAGGQNLIGPEKGAALSVIRSQELLSARRIDGAAQYFTRALDFGYSKTSEESIRIWNRDDILSDMVRIIRKTKPDLIITRFSPERGGHGHHTASAILAIEAFKAAADPKRFPEQLKQKALAPWQAKRILWNSWLPYLRNSDPSLKEKLPKVNLGKYNPLLGLSYMEIAAQSRTMHKSQGFGSVSSRGERYDYFQHLEGVPAKTDIFDGIDTSWHRYPEGQRFRKRAADLLSKYQRHAPEKLVPLLIDFYRVLSREPASFWRNRKLSEIQILIRLCSGLWFEALSDVAVTTPNTPIQLTLNSVNRSAYPIHLTGIEIGGRAVKPFSSVDLSHNKLKTNTFRFQSVQIPQSPYWIREKPGKGLYRYAAADIELNHIPNPNQITCIFKIGSTLFRFETPVIHKRRDPVKGEIRERLLVAPKATINFSEGIYYLPKGKRNRIEVIIKGGPKKIKGTLNLLTPAGWKLDIKKRRTFSIEDPFGEIRIPVEIRSNGLGNTAQISAFIELENQRIDRSHIAVKYDHIPRIDLFPKAEAVLIPVGYKIRKKRIAYIEGSGDELPKYLRQLGYRVELLSDEQLSKNHLQQYDTIITGIRAFNTRKKLSVFNKHLLDYVKKGGNLLVQYSVSRGLATRQIGPYPFSISRRRVTEEDAAVKLLIPTHPLLTKPNAITRADFKGWVQERGLYYADQWDSKYDTPIESHDKGEKANPGGLIYSRYGKGTFIYSGISFFRQVPAGVEGALKLFVNLIEAGSSEK